MTRSTPAGGASWAPAACRLGLAGAVTLPFLFGAAPVLAAVNPVPAVPRNVVVFPERDFVEAEGYAPGTALEFRVLRNGVQIGSATGTTTADGILEVNHPGGSCWDGATPDILGGDVVQVVEPGRTVPPDPAAGTTGEEFGESTVTQRVTALKAYLDGTTVVVKGTAPDGAGGRLPIDVFEQRIVNPAFTDTAIGRRDVRAVADGSGRGTLAYDDATSPHWTARYTFADVEERQAALEGQTRVLAWQFFDPAGEGGLGSRQGLTIYEEDELSGPGMGGCPSSAAWGVTGSSPQAVNIATQAQDLTLSGTSYDSSAVTVTLDDGNPTTTPLTTIGTPAGTGAQTWSVTFPSADVLGLSDGALTASATYTQTTGTIGGAALTLLKDLVAPAPTVAAPAGGTYSASQNVSLTNPEGLPVHVTVDGTAPGADDPVHAAPLKVTSDQAVRSVVIDAAGNPSAVREEAYVIEGDVAAGSPAAAVDAPADPAPAPRNVEHPAAAPRNVVVFPERDFVGAEGFAPDQAVTFVVKRNGSVVGKASGRTDATGGLEVNHPGGVCWDGVTPDLRPGDVVEALTDTTPGHEQGAATTTAHVSAVPAVIEGTDVVVRGTASDAAGNRLPNLDHVEQRIINPDFTGTVIARRDIRAPGQGTIAYDDATGTTWTARYSGLSEAVRNLAVAGQTRVLSWQQFTTDRQGLTIYEAGEGGGPGMGGCAGPADFAVIGSTVEAVNIANAGQGLTLLGTAKDASAVEVHLSDGTTTTSAPGTLAGGAAGSQTWTATFSAEQVATLGPDTETVTASATYTTTAATLGAVDLPILKDLTAPEMPTATPGSAVYATVQSVTLSNPVEKALAIHFTTDGTNPHADDPRYAGQLDVAGGTTVRAVAVDAAGNESAQRVTVYELDIPVPDAPTLSLAAASDSGTAGDGITNDRTPTFTGAAPEGTTVSLRADGVEVATAVVSGGVWSATLTTRTDGTASYDAVAIDSGGRASAPSTALSVRVDATAPAVVIDPAQLPARNSRDAQFVFTSSETAVVECTMTGATTIAPCTSPASFTGLTDGAKTFTAQATDAAGNTGTASYSYTVDATAPTVTAPAVSIVAGATASTGGVPVRVVWSANDTGTGVARYEVRRTENGVAGAVQSLSSATTSQSLSLKPGSTYVFEVRAFDNAGNASAWATRGTVTMKGDDQTSTSVAYTGAWTAGVAQAGSYGGTVAHASANGRNVTYTFTGSSVAWVSTRANNRGRADVYLDGVRVAAAVELYADSTGAGRIMYVNNAVANPGGTHTLQIRVLGTKLGKSKGTRVDADAFLSTPVSAPPATP